MNTPGGEYYYNLDASLFLLLGLATLKHLYTLQLHIFPFYLLNPFGQVECKPWKLAFGYQHASDQSSAQDHRRIEGLNTPHKSQECAPSLLLLAFQCNQEKHTLVQFLVQELLVSAEG